MLLYTHFPNANVPQKDCWNIPNRNDILGLDIVIWGVVGALKIFNKKTPSVHAVIGSKFISDMQIMYDANPPTPFQ